MDQATRDGRDAIYQRCIWAYGFGTQMDMMIEEMSELTKAILKWRRRSELAKREGVDPVTEVYNLRQDIIDEIADVRIMCRQMEIGFHAEKEVEDRITYKVNRQRGRLEGEFGEL